MAAPAPPKAAAEKVVLDKEAQKAFYELVRCYETREWRVGCVRAARCVRGRSCARWFTTRTDR